MEAFLLTTALIAAVSSEQVGSDFNKIFKQSGVKVISCQRDLGFTDYTWVSCAETNTNLSKVMPKVIKFAKLSGWNLLPLTSEDKERERFRFCKKDKCIQMSTDKALGYLLIWNRSYDD